MIVGFVGVGIILVVVFVMIGRMQSTRKKEAIADLSREREELHTPDIIELVQDEVDDAGLRDLAGAEGIDPTVLLKVWKRDRNDCAAGQGRYVTSDGVAPEDATAESVTFECDQTEAEA